MAYLKKPAEQKRRESSGADGFGARKKTASIPAGHAPSSANPPAPASERRLVDILSSAIAEHEQEMITHGEIERLQFFRRTLQRLVVMLEPAPDVFRRHPETRGRLQSITDAVSALHALFTERCPSFANAANDVSRDQYDAGSETTPPLAKRLGGDAAAESATLDMELEGVLFEVAGMRDVLARDHALAALLRPQTGSISEAVRKELIGINVALSGLLQCSSEALGHFPSSMAAQRPPGRPSSAQRPAGFPTAPATRPAPPTVPQHTPAAPPPAQSSVPPIPPWMPQPTPSPVAPAAAPATPPILPWESQATTPPIAPAPAIAKEATGLVLSEADEGFAEKSSGPDAAHRSEEEGVKALQAYFESHSPEGVLPRSYDDEFADLVGRLLRYICPGVSFSQNDMTIRLRQLKDTLALRKKLRNTMTLAEFKAYFRKTR